MKYDIPEPAKPAKPAAPAKPASSCQSSAGSEGESVVSVAAAPASQAQSSDSPNAGEFVLSNAGGSSTSLSEGRPSASSSTSGAFAPPTSNTARSRQSGGSPFGSDRFPGFDSFSGSGSPQQSKRASAGGSQRPHLPFQKPSRSAADRSATSRPAPDRPIPQTKTPSLPKNNLAIAALVCGILALVFCGSVISIVLGLVAISLAGKAAKQVGKDAKATGGKICGVVGIALSVVMLVASVFLAVLSFNIFEEESLESLASAGAEFISEELGVTNGPDASGPDSVGSGAWESGSAIGSASESADEAAAKTAVEDVLSAFLPAWGAAAEATAFALDEGFSENNGLRLAELGVEPEAFSEWLFVGYVVEDAFIYSDGVAGWVDATVTMRNLYEFSYLLEDKVDAFAETAEYARIANDETALTAKVGELFRSAMDETEETTDVYLMFDVVKNNGVWEVDPESLGNELEYLLDI